MKQMDEMQLRSEERAICWHYALGRCFMVQRTIRSPL